MSLSDHMRDADWNRIIEQKDKEIATLRGLLREAHKDLSEWNDGAECGCSASPITTELLKRITAAVKEGE